MEGVKDTEIKGAENNLLHLYVIRLNETCVNYIRIKLMGWPHHEFYFTRRT